MGGTIERLGRLKRLVGLSDEETSAYRCHGCGVGFDVQYHVCPDCGSYRVDAVGD
ncbi:hypothetical protein SAMN04487949_1014 [Halogranum gelatinilyticum]|uniref:Uncharacterized protein n=1 Tax=Halogranum gelatinilyticum TaxID=660521 RepID=A0A1G9QTD6_9EURY|nr:hypothetical protein [Halogranum gelatinilyticum]SDM14233.1 hypothetical protein SAMN04487949_1014 [Halogranum gelatinilyticum]